jgi:hypothetical protein
VCLKRLFYRLYHLSSSITFWLRRRCSPAAYLLIIAVFVFAAAGLDTNLTMAYQGFALLAAILALSFTCSLLSRARFHGRRILPRFGTVGMPLPYRICLENRTARVQRNLILLETLTDPRPSLQQFLQTPEPGERRRNWFDRAGAYYRWSWLVQRNLPARLKDLPVDSIPPKSQLTIQHQFTPKRRGVVRFQDLVVAWPDPFGLFRSLHKIRCPQSVLILPKRYPVGNVKLPGNRQYQPGGVALASAVGESHEFAGLREYRPGDPIRHIHWRSLARFERPIIKEFQDEFFVRHALVLDTFSPHGEDDAFEEAVSVAASFACTIPEEESLLDLLFVGTEAYSFTAGRSVGSIEKLLEVLAAVSPCEGNFTALQALVARHAGLMTGCICVFLRWDEPRKQLLHSMAAIGIPVLAFVIASSEDKSAAADAPVHWLQPGRIAEGLARL